VRKGSTESGGARGSPDSERVGKPVEAPGFGASAKGGADAGATAAAEAPSVTQAADGGAQLLSETSASSDAKKRFLLRLDPLVYAALEKWAADEFRSVNSQMEFLLKAELKRAGRLGGSSRGR